MRTPLEQMCANLAADPSVAGEFKCATLDEMRAWGDGPLGVAMNMGESAGHDARDTSTDSAGTSHLDSAQVAQQTNESGGPQPMIGGEATAGSQQCGSPTSHLSSHPRPLSPALPRWHVQIESGEYYDVAEVHARSMFSAIELAIGSLAEDDGWPLTAAEGTITFRRIG